MIFPLLAVNIPPSLESELKKLKKCLANFYFFIALALTGTMAGALIMDFVPKNMLSIGIGAVSIMYIFFRSGAYILEVLVKKVSEGHGIHRQGPVLSQA